MHVRYSYRDRIRYCNTDDARAGFSSEIQEKKPDENATFNKDM